jgi:hypothetical protein
VATITLVSSPLWIFYVLKSDFNIVNKSFVTLGNALKFYRYNVYIRDTILLAQTVSVSFDYLGGIIRR